MAIYKTYCMKQRLLFKARLFCLSVLLSFFGLFTNAQAPANDNCTGATLLTSATTCNATAGTLINANKTTGSLPACGNNNSADVWYKFVAQTANPKIALSNVGNDLLTASPFIQVLTGSCGSFTSLFCGNTNVLATSGLVISPATTYYIRITTNTNLPSPTTGSYGFNICVMDALPSVGVDYSKAYINITDGTTGGTINHGDVLEIRATLAIKAGTITNISYYDTLKRNAGFIFKDSIATRTNEGKSYKYFSPAFDFDNGWLSPAGLDTAIQINIGSGATPLSGGSLSNTSRPSFYGGTCIIMATYRVTVDTSFSKKINFGGGAFRYKIGGVDQLISFPRDSLQVYETLTACSDAVSPANLIGTASNGTFGSLPNGSSASGTQHAGPAAINTTYIYETFSTGPNDYFYGVANNTSPTNSIVQTLPKTGGTSRVFGIWDITGDHTGAVNPAKGNKPCDPSLPVSAANPCGYLLAINAAFRTDKVFEYTASGVCSETYYEVSAWFKNLCYRCGCDSTGKGAGGGAGYIPTAPGDSSGVRPNIAMQIDGIDYYTTGELKYQGLGGTQTGSDTLNNWVRRSFVFKTAVAQTSFKVTFRNNAPGGGGNDWAVDDIGLRTCYPLMIYAPTNPIVYMGSSLTIRDTVRSYFNSYTFYKWQTKPANGPFAGTWIDVVPASTGNATPVLINGQYEYTISYTIPGTATQATNAGDAYRMVVASNLINLNNGCNFTPSTTFTLLPTDAPCALKDTNYAVAPQTGNINWNKLNWSLGHVPTCCESAFITYTGNNSVADSITVDITNDICIINLNLVNNSTRPNQLFRTILHPGYNMQMNGNVRMGAPATAATDSCVFIARGGGTITVNGNTVIGYPADNAYCILGASPDISANHNYVLKGDSLTFNQKSFTNDKFITVIMNPSVDTAYLVNNTNISPYPNAVSFENLKIGNNVKPTTVIASGINQNAFMNDRGGALEVTSNAKLVLPANYTINAKGIYNSSLLLNSNSTLRIGGYSGGTTGSNFPANFTTYNAAPTSLAEYYGDNSSQQTVFGMNYGKLELRNASNALGTGRAQKNSTAAINSATSINVNAATDFTLGAPVISSGLFNITSGSGLYCRANVVSGAGVFTLGDFSYLGLGHAQGISLLGNATGNMQVTGARNFNIKGNYIYNGTVNQISGNGLPNIVNEFTVDNPGTVINSQNLLVNSIALMKQGLFDIVTTKFTSNGVNGILTSTGGKIKADKGIVEMAGTSGTAQTLSGNWFLNKNISTLINANTKGLTVAAAPADTILISSALLYGSVAGSVISTNDNLTLLSRDTATARFGDITGNTIAGKLTVERYVPLLRKWRLLAINTTSPQTARQSWMEGSSPNANFKPGYGTIVTDTAATWSANGFDSKSISGPSVKYYDYLTDKYFGIPNTQSFDLKTKSAYYNFVRGDRTCIPANAFTSTTILRTTGLLKTGNTDFPVNAGKFEMIGNPYASAVDLRTLVKTNLTPYIYIWDTKITGLFGLGAYQNLMFNGSDYIISPGGGSYGAAGSIMNTIESGQGLFVQSNGAAGNLRFVETAKLKGSNIFSKNNFGRDTGYNYTANEMEACYSLLHLVHDTSRTLVDGAMAVFHKNYNSGVDDGDAPKLVNTSENVSIKRNNAFLAIERRKTVTENDSIFLNLTGLRLAKYEWDISMKNMDAPDRAAFFIDNYTNTATALDLLSVNRMQFDVTNVAESYAPGRFMIIFKQAAVKPTKPFVFTGINAVRNSDKTTTIKYFTNYEKILQNFSLEYSRDKSHFTAMASIVPANNNGGSASYNYTNTEAGNAEQYYRVRSINDTGNIVYSEIAKIGAIQTDPAVNIYPNPVNDKMLNIHFTNMATGSYVLRILNKAGQLFKTQTIRVNSSDEQKNIKLAADTPAGSYQLRLQDANGKAKTLTFIVK